MIKKSPTGSITAHAGSTAPIGYLLCDGSAVSRTDYANLFAIISTSFGVGDGSTTFNIPDGRGKTFFGYNSGDSNFNALGKTGGTKTANLQHSHTANNHTHSASGNSGNAGSGTAGTNTNTTVADQNHYHSVTVNTGNQTDTGSNNQLSATQSVLVPYLTLNWIIKT